MKNEEFTEGRGLRWSVHSCYCSFDYGYATIRLVTTSCASFQPVHFSLQFILLSEKKILFNTFLPHLKNIALIRKILINGQSHSLPLIDIKWKQGLYP